MGFVILVVGKGGGLIWEGGAVEVYVLLVGTLALFQIFPWIVVLSDCMLELIMFLAWF